MEPLAQDQIVARAQGPVAADLGAGESALMSVANGTYYGLNTVGTRVWQLLEQPRSIAAICRAISEEYAVEPARCEADVSALLEQLRAEGLLRLIDDESPR